jgi:hypothetical protein
MRGGYVTCRPIISSTRTSPQVSKKYNTVVFTLIKLSLSDKLCEILLLKQSHLIMPCSRNVPELSKNGIDPFNDNEAIN